MGILLPSLEVDEDFISLDMEDGRTVHFYSIVPLYSEELDFKLKHGSDPLLDKFEEYGVNELVDLKRRNTCEAG
jgi:hypothetical protein